MSPRWRALRRRATAAGLERVRIDARSLAAFRIALGLLLAADLALRARSLTAFYTDAGVYPRAAFLARSDPLHPSLHVVSGTAAGQALLFALAGGFAVALIVGYRTRIATAGSWLLVVSLHNRVPMVLNGGDFLLRLLLFWAIFLPLGARWSVDARHAGAGRRRAAVTSAAGAALLAQVVLVYLTNAALKLSGDVWTRGDGLEAVLSLRQFTVLLGDHLADLPSVAPLAGALDYLWLAMVSSSFLLVVLTGRRRTALVSLFVAAHLGMGLTLRIDLFPLVAVAGLLPFLPATFWDRVTVRLGWSRPAIALDRALAWLAAVLPAVAVSGASSSPRLRRWGGRARTVIPLVFLVLVVLWNLQVLGYDRVAGRETLPGEAEAVVELTRTDQYWTMFAPDPLSTDGWVVVEGRLANGSRVDALRGGAVRWDRPPDVSASYPTARWRKYLVGLWRDDTADRRLFAEHLCRRWNGEHRTTLVGVSVHFVEQPTRLDAGREPTERVTLVDHACR